MSTLNRDRQTIAMLLYPGFTALDLVGPHHVFAALEGYEVQLIWKTDDLVTSDTGLSLKPTMTLRDCPEQLAVLFIPGGTHGTIAMMQDPDVLSFVRSRGEQSDYVTSVCTGSLVLGAAGLLRGYHATSHWGALGILNLLGAEPKTDRVVRDRNRFTGGGVTAGIDFGLTLAAQIKGDRYAQGVQLIMEYAPNPPFNSGTPETAPEELTTHAQTMFAPFLQAAREAAVAVSATWSNAGMDSNNTAPKNTLL
ncbi:MAG: DJ-1/PfpI family protein [Cyanothece sp. SIO2G6]|nr:DJ-1/PfpI family protein [Cyanothece sp. SIO2G6]